MVRKTLRYPRPAPHKTSANAAALASLSTLTGTLYFCEISSAKGNSRQQGRLGGLIITPVLGSSGPGQQMPMPRNERSPPELAAFAQTSSMALTTVARAATGPSFGNMGTRV